MGYFEKSLSYVKTVLASLGKKIGLIFTPTSGHTESDGIVAAKIVTEKNVNLKITFYAEFENHPPSFVLGQTK